MAYAISLYKRFKLIYGKTMGLLEKWKWAQVQILNIKNVIKSNLDGSSDRLEMGLVIIGNYRARIAFITSLKILCEERCNGVNK